MIRDVNLYYPPNAKLLDSVCHIPIQKLERDLERELPVFSWLRKDPRLANDYLMTQGDEYDHVTISRDRLKDFTDLLREKDLSSTTGKQPFIVLTPVEDDINKEAPFHTVLLETKLYNTYKEKARIELREWTKLSQLLTPSIAQPEQQEMSRTQS